MRTVDGVRSAGVFNWVSFSRMKLPLSLTLACCPVILALTISPEVLPSPVLEGTELVITCTTAGVGAGAIVLLINDRVSEVAGVIQSVISVRVFKVPVDRSHHGAKFTCASQFDNTMSQDVTLSEVQWPPSFSLSVSVGSVLQHVEGGNQMLTVQRLDLGNPPAPGVEWSVNRGGLTSGGGVIVSDASISFSDVRRSHSGEYTAGVRNKIGSMTTGFVLKVIPAYSIDHYTINGPLLSIIPVGRSDSGRYSCTANNTAGIITMVSFTLNVVVPPGSPRKVVFPSIGPYSVTVRWNPPSDIGGTPDPLNYMVALTTTSDGQSVFANQTAQTQRTFTALSHSENYTVSVVAINSLGQQGPSAVRAFRTNGIFPVINSVAAKVLSLRDVQITIILNETGGQPVENTVTINGTVMTFSGSADLQFIGNVTGLSLMNGVTYNVTVVARNRVGDSEMFLGMLYVPFPPNFTMPPVEVTPDETTTRCCAGVRVFLEDPSDPTLVFTAQVSKEGSPFTACSVTREGDVVYVQGLQAGTPYNIRLTGWNQFGSVTKEVSTTPLIGFPSDPSMPVVSVEGSSVSIQLSTRYPGTNARGQFRFSLIFSAVSTAKRQSLQATEVQVDPTGLNSSVNSTHTLTDVAAGSYSVSVMAENENGMSQDVKAKFVVEEYGQTELVTTSFNVEASGSHLLSTVIGLGAALTVVFMLFAVTTSTSVFFCICYTKHRKLVPISQSKSTIEPHEDSGGGVTSHDVVMEENPAYQMIMMEATN